MISSNNLYHFTPKFEYLRSILNEGLRISYCLEDFSWLKRNDLEDFSLTPLTEERIEFRIPMTCFCDIPSNLIEKHANVYGNYGIGFDKDWGRNKGINPLLYLAERSNLSSYLRDLEKLTQGIPKDDPEYRSRNAVVNLLSCTKPYEGDFNKGDYRNKSHRFYDEREWRYLPPANIITRMMDVAQYEVLSADDKIPDRIEFDPKKVGVIVVDASEEKNLLEEECEDYHGKIMTIEEFSLEAR
ncbi:MAG: abortive infection system antitoxin AbiGi family protein [Tunicatimonas sp.]